MYLAWEVGNKNKTFPTVFIDILSVQYIRDNKYCIIMYNINTVHDNVILYMILYCTTAVQQMINLIMKYSKEQEDLSDLVTSVGL